VLPPFEARMHAATIELLEERLGGGALTRLLREGAAMTLEAAAELGRELASREAPPAAADPATP